MKQSELDEVKDACCVIIGDMLGHFVDKHAVSEHEQELLESFAGTCQHAVRSVHPIDEQEVSE